MPQLAKPKTKVQRRDIGPLSMRAAFKPGSANGDDRTVEMIWTTGARVLRHGWDGPFYEELSLDPKHVRMERLNNGAPLLNSHNQWDLRDVIGVVESASLKGAEGTATVRFSKRDDVEPIFRDVQDGIIQNVSVGYRVYRFELVEGGDDEIPVYRAVDWEPYELSAVPAGADDGAGFRSNDKQETNPCEIFTTRGGSARQEQTTMLTKEQIAALRALALARKLGVTVVDELIASGVEFEAARAQLEATPIPVDTDAVRAAGVSEERARAAGIREAVRAAKLDEAFATELVDSGVSLDAARAQVIDKLAKTQADSQPNTRSQHVAVQVDESDKFARGVGDWLIQKAGHADVMKKRGHDVDPGEFRGLTLLDLARRSLELRGVKTAGMDKVKIAQMACGMRGVLGGLNTTSDFPNILENTLHKLLLASYATTPDTWTRFCRVGSVSDFRAHNRYMLGSFGALDSKTEHGEFKNKSIPDAEKQSITAATKGNIIGITREAIVNDDMNAFSSLAFMLGRAGKLSIEKDVYALLALNAGLGPTMSDGLTLFHATHANIGTGAALSVAALDADRVVMGSQTDVSGNEILELRPQALLLPLSLGGEARVINDAQYDPDTANKLQRPNKVRGLFSDIVDTARLTGTRRYMFADPNVAPTLEVAFLDGQREPYLEMQEGFRVDGIEWKVRLDYAAGAVGFRGAVTNAGA